MNYTHQSLRKAFVDFWESKNHKEAPPAPLVLTNDPTTLFNSSGMQQLIPYLQGEPHPEGKKLYNIQPCFRAVDIDEVGDNRHTTFFEMLGNWSLGDYFKKEQLTWFWEFLTGELKLDKDKLVATYFGGGDENNIVVDKFGKKQNLPPDLESKQILLSLGISENHIKPYGFDKNWWSRSGPPNLMPAGEIGGPDSEIFYDFGGNLKLHEKSGINTKCHPNCECGRFLEIGNSVFIQYRKKEDGTLEELSQKNVDFGGGLERFLAALNDNPDVFSTDIFLTIIQAIENETKKQYSDPGNQPAIRIIADHVKAAAFMIIQGISPSNKEHGYIVRRLLRRSTVKFGQLAGTYDVGSISKIARQVLNMYNNVYFNKFDELTITKVTETIDDEVARFSKSIDHGMKVIQKINSIDGKVAFDLYQNLGFPLELTEELALEKGLHIDVDQFRREFEKHRELSRTASAGKFKGGLADHSEQVVKYHTATHLIHQALFDIFGNDIQQEGSNITGARLRFDFSTRKNPTKEEIKKIEEIVKGKVNDRLPVSFIMMPREEAFKIGARAFFKEKYPEQVKVYYIGEIVDTAYSRELCGGPHVKNTSEVGPITIYKFEKIGNNLYRIYAK